MQKFIIKMIKYFLLLTVLFYSTISRAQIALEIVNEANESIDKVQLIDDKNKVIALSEADGHIHSDANPNQSYTLRKIGFKDQKISNLQPNQKLIFMSNSKKEVVITGKRNDTKKTTGIEVLDKCELGKLACCNLAESFENSNTVDVNYSDGITGGREIQMLGLAGTYSQQLIEGTPYHRGILSKIGLELVPGPWIESIGVNKGIGSVANGYENISGQINIEFLKPKRSLDWFMNGYVSEIGKSDFNLVKGIKLSDKIYTNFLAHTSFSKMTMDNNHDGFSDMPVFTNYNLMNKWQYFADNGFVLNVTLQGSRMENEAGQILSGDHASHSAHPYIIKQLTHSYHALVKTGWELDAVKESSLAVIYRLNYATQSGNLDSRPIDNQQIYASISPIYQSNLNSENQKIKLGLNLVYNKEDERIGGMTFNKNEQVAGAFSELNLKNEWVSTTIGLRVDYHNTLGVFVSPRASVTFNPTENHVLKLSSGAGFRTPTYLTEAMSYMVSNRQVHLPTELRAEKAINSGLSYKYTYKLFGASSTLEASYFLTLFQNQLILNIENPRELKLEYINENSRAQSFQIDNQIQLTQNWSLKLSYKNDQTIASFDTEQKNIPLLKNDKYLANLYWVSTKEKYSISTTLLINGSARLPKSTTNAESYSPTYPILHFQFNYVPTKKMDFYIGAENIFAYQQYDRIIQYDNTAHPDYDAGMIWGPMDVRRMYIGGKLSF
jgi:outer membrane receptor for ferrienterochelin and colicins